MSKKAGGYLLILFSLFMLLGLFVEGNPSLLANVFSFFLFVVGPMFGGAILLRSVGKAKKRAAVEAKKQLQAEHEKEILRLAEQKKGLLTVSQIVKETSIDASEAETMLHELIIKRMVDMRSSFDGQVVYEFHQFTSAEGLDNRQRTQESQ